MIDHCLRCTPLTVNSSCAGGPDRLSRLDMALQVAETYGFDGQSSIIAVPSASVNRGVASPADISMSVDRCAAPPCHNVAMCTPQHILVVVLQRQVVSHGKEEHR